MLVRNIRRIALILPVMMGLIAPSGAMAEKGKVIWRVTDWPPFYFHTGPRAGTGLYDRMIQTFQAALPQFSHSNVVMTTQRALQLMKDGQRNLAVCHVSMLKSSLTGFAHPSNLDSVLLPHVIIARAPVAQRIRAELADASGHVSINRLVLNKDFRGAVASFGTHEALLKYQHASSSLPNITLTAENYMMLAHLALESRVDYIVQYSIFIDTLKALGAEAGRFETIPILETKGTFVPAYTGCTRNDIGLEVITVINDLLEKQPEVLNELRFAPYDAADRARLKAIYKTFEQGPHERD